MRVATAAYPIDWFESWTDYHSKLSRWVEEAAGQGAQLLVFPEFGAMELASLAGREAASRLDRQVGAIAAVAGRVDGLHAALAARHGVHIVAASLPVRSGTSIVNRARLFAPQGSVGWHDKLMLTPFERKWPIDAGTGATVFETALGRIGICICYDAEFPLIARAMAEAGAEVIAVPSCTDTAAGYARVRIGAMARALENQIFTLHAPTVGSAPWSPVVDPNVGAAAIYGPPDVALTSSGVIAEGTLNAPGWVYANLDLDAVRKVRESGEVLVAHHWPEQLPRLAGPAKLLKLT